MTRVYRYGLLAPTDGADRVDAQMDLAWRAACAKVAIEQAYRDQIAEAMQRHAPTVASVASLTALRQDARARLASLRTSAARADTPEAHALRQEVRALGEQIKALRPQAAEERRAVRAAGSLRSLDAARKAAHLDQARAWSAAGLFWGTRQLVEAAHDQRCKQYLDRRLVPPATWDRVGVQIMGGMSGAAFASGGDGRVTLSASLPVPGRGGRPLPRVTVRIGRDGGTATWPVILHRPVPVAGSIRQVVVQCQRLGRQVRWSLLLTVTLPAVVQASAGDAPVIAVCPAPATVGSLTTAALWMDSDGTSGAYVLSPGILRRLDHAADLQAVRDQRRDVLMAAMRDWIAVHGRPATWPVSLLMWESCDRWRAWVQTWARQRVAGDAELFAQAEAWAVQDRHLWDWAAHDRARGLARRQHDYRCWAASLVRQYAGVLVPTQVYAVTKQQRAVPERVQVPHAVARIRDRVSPGALRQALVQAFEAAGKPVWRVAGETAAQMLRERSGAVICSAPARMAKFQRLKQMQADRSERSGETRDQSAPLAGAAVSAGVGVG